MAVPQKGAQVIFEALLKCFADVAYETTRYNINPLIHKNHTEIYNRVSQQEQLVLFEKIEKLRHKIGVIE